MSTVRRWTPEELEQLREDVCELLNAVADLLREIRFLLDEK